jgi:biotin synthase-related radical SAM superfamily protein
MANSEQPKLIACSIPQGGLICVYFSTTKNTPIKATIYIKNNVQTVNVVLRATNQKLHHNIINVENSVIKYIEKVCNCYSAIWIKDIETHQLTRYILK